MSTLAASACSSSSTSSSVLAPTASKCQVTATASPSSFPATGGSGTLAISADRDCTWSAAADANWIGLSGDQNGQGPASMRYTVAANAVPAARHATISVGAQQIAIGQDAAPCEFQIDRTTAQVGNAGGSVSVSVTALAGCGWTAASQASWITVQSGASGTGNGRTILTAAVNMGAARSGRATIAGRTITLTQDGADAPPAPPTPPSPSPSPSPAPPPPGSPPPPPSPPSCSFKITPTTVKIGPGGGTAKVSVSADAACSWSATSNADWIAVASGAQGTGNGQVQLAIAPNPTTSPRSDLVMIAGTAVTVNQDGSAPPPAVDISGTISGLSGACPTLSFQLSGQTIVTSPKTDYKHGTCGDLQNGTNVSGNAQPQPDGTLLALHLDVQADGHHH